MRSQLNKRIRPWFRWIGRARNWVPSRPERCARTHVIILDGTMSTLRPGDETNAGLTYNLLRGTSKELMLYYAPGIQWQDWKTTHHVLIGRGINQQIRAAYGVLASRYKPGDSIYLFGYSRGAFAVRSLSGLIDRIGLLKAEHATERNVMTAYRHYQFAPNSNTASLFAQQKCHNHTPIEMIGVWDTVKALGLRFPGLNSLSSWQYAFHDARLSRTVGHGYHALAMDETRVVFEPVMWVSRDAWENRVTQMWFRGTHGDVGGQLAGRVEARPLSNIPLVWMLERAQEHGLPLPEGWQEKFPCSVDAPSGGHWSGWSKIFLLRKARIIGVDRSECIHSRVRPSKIDEIISEALPSFSK